MQQGRRFGETGAANDRMSMANSVSRLRIRDGVLKVESLGRCLSRSRTPRRAASRPAQICENPHGTVTSRRTRSREILGKPCGNRLCDSSSRAAPSVGERLSDSGRDARFCGEAPIAPRRAVADGRDAGVEPLPDVRARGGVAPGQRRAALQTASSYLPSTLRAVARLIHRRGSTRTQPSRPICSTTTVSRSPLGQITS